MLRHVLATAVILAAVAVPFLGACDANVVESCLGGPCSLPGSGSVGAASSSGTTTSSSSSSSGTVVDGGADGGDAAPPLDARNCMSVPKTGDFPCDVFKVIHGVCNKCHTNPQQNGAPFQLLTYADTQQPFPALLVPNCHSDADCGVTPGSCNVATGVCSGLRFQQMFISIGPNGDPQMPFGLGMLPDVPAGHGEYSTLHDWLGNCAPPVPLGTGCGCPGNGCN